MKLATPQQLPGAPAHIAAALDRLKDDLARAAGQNLAGLVLYGGLARGRYRSVRSDVNLIVLLHDASAAALAAIAPALRTAWRAAGVNPLLLTPAEVSRTAEAFPTKFLDIKNHHILLAGADPFTGLQIAREQIRLRTEQGLRNLLLRLRRRYISLGGDSSLLAQALARSARPLALELKSLLQLAGKDLPAEDRTAAVFEAAAAAFGLEPAPLAQMAQFRQNHQPVGDVDELVRGVLGAIARAAEVACGMSESRP
jgi:hypothetical protein